MVGSIAFLGLVVWSWYAVFPSVRQLDPRNLGQGTEAPLAEAPRSWLAATKRCAVGSGWIAWKGLDGWRVLAVADVSGAALVPPSLALEFARVRDWRAHGPYLVLRTLTGRVLRIDVHAVNDEVRAHLAHQLPADSVHTPLARRYLDSGEVPGRWDRPWQVWGFRFGQAKPPASAVPAVPLWDPSNVYAPPPAQPNA